jgi:hypothetical protein
LASERRRSILNSSLEHSTLITPTTLAQIAAALGPEMDPAKSLEQAYRLHLSAHAFVTKLKNMSPEDRIIEFTESGLKQHLQNTDASDSILFDPRSRDTGEAGRILAEEGNWEIKTPRAFLEAIKRFLQAKYARSGNPAGWKYDFDNLTRIPPEHEARWNELDTILLLHPGNAPTATESEKTELAALKADQNALLHFRFPKHFLQAMIRWHRQTKSESVKRGHRARQREANRKASHQSFVS